MISKSVSWLAVGAFAAAVVASPAVAAVFKCQEGGKTVYQDRPCADTGTSTTVRPTIDTVTYKAPVANAKAATDPLKKAQKDADRKLTDEPSKAK